MYSPSCIGYNKYRYRYRCLMLHIAGLNHFNIKSKIKGDNDFNKYGHLYF